MSNSTDGLRDKTVSARTNDCEVKQSFKYMSHTVVEKVERAAQHQVVCR